jgi:hypothetical protein
MVARADSRNDEHVMSSKTCVIKALLLVDPLAGSVEKRYFLKENAGRTFSVYERGYTHSYHSNCVACAMRGLGASD